MTIFILLIILAAISVLLATKKPNKNVNDIKNTSLSITTEEKTENEIYPYIARNSILTENERKLYFCLKEICKEKKIDIFAKVRLLDIIDILPNMDKKYFWKVQAKHVDFVLCDSYTFKPLVVIELNDKTHKNNDRIERDVFVSNVLNKANIPIVFLPSQSYYNPNEIIEKLSSYLLTKA